MRIVIFLTVFLFGFGSFSQKLDSVMQHQILTSIYKMDFEKDFRKVIDSCDKYLKYDFSVCMYKAGLFALKADAINNYLIFYFDLDYFDWENDSVISQVYHLENQIITNYDSAINSCKSCELTYIKQKYEFLNVAKNFVINQQELKRLKSYGFKPEQEFWSISPQYFYGNNEWIGAEISVDFLQQRYKLQNIDSSIMYAASGLNIGLRTNISSSKGWGMNFSLASYSWNWINLRPINFSYLNNGKNKSWGYAPELGFQVWYLHLNAGYNLAFKKSMRSYEKLYFTAKFDIPFYRF